LGGRRRLPGTELGTEVGDLAFQIGLLGLEALDGLRGHLAAVLGGGADRTRTALPLCREVDAEDDGEEGQPEGAPPDPEVEASPRTAQRVTEAAEVRVDRRAG